LRALPARAAGSDLKDRETEGRTTTHPSVYHSDQIRLRPLSRSEKRLVRWLERYVPVTPQTDTVHTKKAPQTFYRATPFVRKYTAQLILEALKDMTHRVQDLPDGPAWRCWRSEIVSPARLLNHSVIQLAAEARETWERSYQ
jgi:hypothetical protein